MRISHHDNSSMGSVCAGWRRLVLTPEGFTLLELLMVVAIIAVLSAIAMPVFKNYLDKARNSRAMAEIRVIESQLALYQSETGVLPEHLEDMGSVQRDPWGRPYYYTLLAGKSLTGPGKVSPRKNRFLHPLNSDYDLYSAGVDGETQLALTATSSHDDIIRANDGQFVGLAKYY